MLQLGGGFCLCMQLAVVGVCSGLLKIFKTAHIFVWIIFADAFRQGLSTTLALLKLQDHILEQNSKKLFTCAIFLDLKKAFDTVDHQILLGKLSQYGLRGSTNKFFESYLSKRKQFVCANHIKSNTKYVTCGVPQGSTLCPILFLLRLALSFFLYLFFIVHKQPTLRN